MLSWNVKSLQTILTLYQTDFLSNRQKNVMPKKNQNEEYPVNQGRNQEPHKHLR